MSRTLFVGVFGNIFGYSTKPSKKLLRVTTNDSWGGTSELFFPVSMVETRLYVLEYSSLGLRASDFWKDIPSPWVFTRLSTEVSDQGLHKWRVVFLPGTTHPLFPQKTFLEGRFPSTLRKGISERWSDLLWVISSILVSKRFDLPWIFLMSPFGVI